MKRRWMALALCAALIWTLGVPLTRAAGAAGAVTLTAASAGENKLAVTVSVKRVTFNVLQLYVAYDSTRLTPSETEYLVGKYDAWRNPDGWMSASETADEANSVTRYVLIADPAAAGLGKLDENGYYHAPESGTALMRLNFDVKPDAVLYADSVRLGSGESAPSGVVIASSDDETGGYDAPEIAKVDLSAVAKSEKTPGGVTGGHFGEKPAPPEDETTPSGGGTSGGGTTKPSGGNGEKPAQSGSFHDMSAHGWAAEAVEAMAKAGIVTGTGNGRFTPGANIRRGDFVVMLMRMMKPENKTAPTFSDVAAGSYWEQDIRTARALGIAQGGDGNRFRPQDPITRQDMIVLTTRALAATEYRTLSGKQASLSGYEDGAQVSAYAADAMAQAVADGLIAGSGNRLNPRGNTTRAEAAVFLYRIWKQGK